jgi:arylsulfatase A-like enzyme
LRSLLLKRILLGAAVGTAIGLACFAAEAALILQPGAAGISIDVQGPLQSLLRAARPLLPGILLRVAVAYAAAGAILGVAAAFLALCFPVRRWGAFIALCLVELLGLIALLVWDRVVARPALMDDLAVGSRVFEWLVTRGDPLQPRVLFAAVLGAHALVGARRAGAKLWPALGIIASLGAVAVAVKSPGRSPSKHPLVVLIGIDAFRPDRLKANGGTGHVAPHLDAFIQDATLFDRAYTPLAQTGPAWRSLLTARWPHRTGVRYPLTAERRWQPAPTFSEELGRAGYSTSFHTDCSRFNYQGPQSGFEVREQPPRGAVNFVLEKMRFRGLGMFADNALGSAWVPEFIDNRALAGIHDPIGYAERLARALVSEAERGPALFAFHGTAAHFPGDPVFPFYRQFVDGNEPLQKRIRMFFAPVSANASGGWNRSGSEALYDELLSQADAQLGILLAALREHALYDEALIVVFSDHGESFYGDTPALWGATPVHGARLGDEENRILLAIKLPASRRPQPKPDRVDALVRLIDIGPTLLELSGAPPLADADGVSLVPLLEGKPMMGLNLLAETGFTHVAPDAFDSEHVALAPRNLDAYEISPDGAVEVSDAAHRAVMAEKDVGAFDGRSWIIRRRLKDGTVVQKCEGECFDDVLTEWFNRVSTGWWPADS